ncbi:hypothetical protein WN51_07926 [Melipona quadrifasciata]|uniref:Uncharacterized protein n=1 Tax=Melipona quadrifasciata TaxID=166423 RepID=A0A0M8ZQK3_9HYME|nr:hypothetical protein WN51_07926 [Melipona quadrifasciata]
MDCKCCCMSHPAAETLLEGLALSFGVSGKSVYRPEVNVQAATSTRGRQMSQLVRACSSVPILNRKLKGEDWETYKAKEIDQILNINLSSFKNPGELLITAMLHNYVLRALMTFKIGSSPVTYRPSPGASLSNAKPGSNATDVTNAAPFRLQTRNHGIIASYREEEKDLKIPFAMDRDESLFETKRPRPSSWVFLTTEYGLQIMQQIVVQRILKSLEIVQESSDAYSDRHASDYKAVFQMAWSKIARKASKLPGGLSSMHITRVVATPTDKLFFPPCRRELPGEAVNNCGVYATLQP